MPKRILIVSPTDSRSGAGLFRHALAGGLRRAGHEVVLAQPEEHSPIQAAEAELGIEHHFFTRDPYRDILAFAQDQALATAELRRSAPDFVVFSSGVSPLCHYPFLDAVEHAQTPYMMVEHQVSASLFTFDPRTAARFAEFYRKAAAVVAVSEENLRTLRQALNLPDRVGRVIVYGRPEEFFRPRDAAVRAALRREWGVADDALAVLTVAKLEPVKGHRIQIEMMRRLKTEALWRDLVFVWIGDGVEREALERALAGAGVAGRARLLGHRFDVAQLYDGGDLLAMTSLSEGMPLTVMEAMAKGLPPICTDVGGTAEAIGDAGIVLPAPMGDGRTVAELAATLRELVSDRARLGRLSARARQRAAALFREDRMLEEYLDLIGRGLSPKLVVAARPGPAAAVAAFPDGGGNALPTLRPSPRPG
jgi:glycosyltransferase involved in cell wall biosynthesis